MIPPQSTSLGALNGNLVQHPRGGANPAWRVGNRPRHSLHFTASLLYRMLVLMQILSADRFWTFALGSTVARTVC